MKILAIEIENPNVSSQDFEPHLKAEAKQLYELVQQYIVRETWFRADKKCAVLVLECESIEKARNILNTLPLVENNLITFDLIPLAPYTGFSRLFDI